MSLVEGLVHVIICAGLQTHPVKKPLRHTTSVPLLKQFNDGGQLVQVYRSVLAYLFCYAQRAKSICSVQIQVVLGPADNLFLTFPFGVSLKNRKGQK